MDALTLIFVVILVWLVAAIWIFALINLAVTGDISVGEAALGIAIALLLSIATARQAFPYAPLVSLLTLGGGAIAIPFLRSYINKRAHAEIDAEVLERACLAYEMDPKNFGALIQLADTCYRNNLLEHAVHYLRQAVQQAPMYTTAEKRRLSYWEEELQDIKPMWRIPCMVCGATNPIGPLRCVRCQSLLLPTFLRMRWMPKRLFQKVVQSWIVSAFALALMFVWMDVLRGLTALVAIVATMGVAVVLLWLIFRR